MSNPHEGRRAVEAVWRIESARIVGALARTVNDFSLAEDLAQEAFAEALVTWPRDGVPDNPAGWLLTVGRRRAVDTFRRRTAGNARYQVLGAELAIQQSADETDADLLLDPDHVEDDLLRLIFIACHPMLSPQSQVALTLRTVGGLTSDEIARAFLVPTATIQARITRAKKTLTAARVPFQLPEAHERADRLRQVLSVIYLLFTEGSSASTGEALIRFDLAAEAIRLARIVARLAPDDSEPAGLLALTELTAARFGARTTADGAPILLEDQDRRRWDVAAIRRGLAALDRAQRVGRGLGPYGLQAAIAACHARAASVAETDWTTIVMLYEALERIAPSPIVTLNRAVALSMATGPAAALELVEALAAEGQLRGSHLLPSVRGELLRRLGRTDAARAAFEEAYTLCPSPRERETLATKITLLAT
ncbi:RNA polymerase sigma factor [Nocardioides sp. Bht2]|uniref:RNA polymerase sigma factor n=1 Tax=Nocardioides sp. Bht2 TaxID=3392297 RepID=UPI0039B4D33B